MFFSLKIGHVDQIWSKVGFFCQKGQFLAKISQIALDDSSSLGNFIPKNNEKNDFFKFEFSGGLFSDPPYL